MAELAADAGEDLTRRAQRFVGVHGVEVEVRPFAEDRQHWLALDVPAEVIDRMAAYHRRWGGLALPPAPHYDGGPRWFEPDLPERSDQGWAFEAGLPRTAVPYSFVIGPDGEFGIAAERYVPLYATIEGWVESVALAHEAFLDAEQVTKYSGDEVDELQLDGFEPMPEVRGVADTWWRGPDSLVAICTGEAVCLDHSPSRAAIRYSGIR
ncbi:hypothetical protein [Labedaea rhizosphaerae]|uniref:SUKH-3 immunity protein of toxin-antitoxin system n=1 Tax=Labedaea rhizosphaerae TaxID=598644 RepID=A0A4R6SLW6_LABRH|nr:hypothetical protein [Labedaea rhizosphaerae]TDQ04967.1 hypothetical protein EV186_101931 [Labedaea rhizosphaerae]